MTKGNGLVHHILSLAGRDGADWQLVFRREDDDVVFERVDPPGGWR